ncbi:MAG: hypothetical protein V1772_02360, partial [Chloroflexota bacterium]
TFSLERLDVPDRPSVTVRVPVTDLRHNETLRAAWPPLADSRGAAYRLTVTSDGEYGVGFWATGGEAYAGGALLLDGAPQAGDLYFRTYYDYRLTDALADAAAALGGLAGQGLAWLVLLVLPGAALAVWLLPRSERPLAVDAALAVSLSLASWPLVLWWCGAARLPLLGARLWVLLAGWAGLLAWGLWRRWPTWAGLRRRLGLPELALALVLLVTLAARLVQARTLLVGSWVDSVHHSVITRVLMEQGLAPRSLEPYAPVSDFHYHLGFHANAAVLGWLARLRPEQAVLLYGQVLSALAGLMVAGLAVTWGAAAEGCPATCGRARRWAAPGAALAVGLLAHMPAYYVSWGRYTQLAGLALLPAVCLVTGWCWRARRPGWRLWLLGGLLVGGLVASHYRVLVFYVLFWFCYALAHLWRERHAFLPALGQLARAAALLAGLGLLACLPLAARMALRVLPSVATSYGGWVAAEGMDTDFPRGLLAAGWTRPLLYLSAAGAAWAGARRRIELLLVPVWTALCFVPANPPWLGLPNTWFLHNTAVFISYWVPVGLLLGWLVAELAEGAARGLAWLARRWGGSAAGARWAVGWVLLGALLALGGWRAWQTMDVLNLKTALVSAEDYQALQWARDHTPADARFLINTWRWQGELRAGSDAGAWLPLVADRQTSLPCALYAQADRAAVRAINGLASAVEEAPALDAPALLERLAEAGITHAFVGSRGGRLMPKELDASPHYRLLYALGPTRIYALQFIVAP